MKTQRKTNPETSKPKPKRKGNPHRKRRKNGAGLGAFLGSLGGSVASGILSAAGTPLGIGVPLYIILSAGGGALGGHYAAPKDRQRRGAEGGGIGGVFGPIGAAIGGYIGGTKPDRHKNPSSTVIAGSLVAVAAVGAAIGVRHVMRKRAAAAKALPSKQPNATPENQGAGPAIPAASVPKAVLDAELLKGGYQFEPWWKTVNARLYKGHYIRIDEDMRFRQPYINAEGDVCEQTNVRWVVVASEAAPTPLASGRLEKANACSVAPKNIAGDLALAKIYDMAALAAMDWISVAYPAPKTA